MTRARVAFLVLALMLLMMVSSFSGAPSVVAAEPTGPVITSHTAGEEVSGQVEVSVSSTAPYVLVAWGPEADSAWVYATQTQEGVARASLSSSGYAGPTVIVARECQSPCAGDWGSTSLPAETSVRVEVSNSAPEWNLNAWVTEFHGDGLLWGVDGNRWAWYGFFIDGEYVPSVDDTGFVAFEAARLGDGLHTVQMAHCTEHSHRIIEPVVCDMTHASETRSFTIRTALHPTITSLRPRTISPDNNGIADVASATMTADTRQLVGWELRKGAQTVARGPWAEREPGPYTFTVDGLDADGQPLASGTYLLRVRSSSLPPVSPDVDDRMITGETSTLLRIDRTAPRVTSVSATPRVFHPPADGYRDRLRITGILSEPASRFKVRVRRSGSVVRRLWLGPRPAGGFTTRWGGRGPGGRLLRPGTYRYDFVTRDRAGNQAIRGGGQVVLDWRR